MSLKETIEDNLYSYDANEFQPIWREGHLDNRAEFALYKAEQVAEALGRLASRTVNVASTVGSVIVEHIAQDAE